MDNTEEKLPSIRRDVSQTWGLVISNLGIDFMTRLPAREGKPIQTGRRAMAPPPTWISDDDGANPFTSPRGVASWPIRQKSGYVLRGHTKKGGTRGTATPIAVEPSFHSLLGKSHGFMTSRFPKRLRRPFVGRRSQNLG